MKALALNPFKIRFINRISVSAIFSAAACVLGMATAPSTALAASAPSKQQASEIRLSEVQVTGVTVFGNERIEGTMELGPGDLLDRSRVVKTAQNIQELYRKHGYEEVTIDSRLLPGRILEIAVKEGLPTRISEIDFIAEAEPTSLSAREAWKRARRAMTVAAQFQQGDVLDQEKVATEKRVFQDILVTQEYIGARVDEVTAVPVSAPAADVGAKNHAAGKWVKLEFSVRLGDRVTFGFRDNHVISSSRLTAIVDEQRTLGLGQDFINVIRSRIEEEYRSIGYARAKVTSYTFENPQTDERHVTYQISEGPRIYIDAVDFDGNSVFKSDELRERFYALAPNMVQRGYYVEKDAQRAAELVVEWMKSKGYLGAKLVTINKSYVPRGRADERDTRVRLVIYLYESEQTLVQSIRISGSTVFTDADLKKYLSIEENEPLNIFAFSEGLEKLKTAYRSKGYLSISVENEGTDKVIHYSDENRLADINLNLKEGPQFKISRVLIEGRRKTQEYVITRELVLHEGDVLEEPKIGESESNLRKLGIFSIVRVSALDDPDQADHKILKVYVEEADPGIVAGGPGFRNDLGIRGFAELGYTNLGGADQSLFFNAAANRRVDHTFRFAEYQTQLAYSWPWFAGLDLNFRPTLSLSGTEYRNFDAVTADLALNWEKKIFKKPNFSALFTYDIERVHQFDAPVEDTIDNNTFLIGSVTPALRLDMRDNPLAPTRGLFSEASFEFADPVLLSQRAPSPIGYFRFQTRTDYTVPLAPMMSWFFSVRTGFEKSTVSRAGADTFGAIPLIKTFALGGVGSLRGFSEQELSTTDVIKGTLSYVNYRTQIDLPVSGGLRFGPFLDAANLREDSFSLGALRYGTGFGLHYLTPVGPVNLDWGFKLDARPGEDTNQFYFSIGVL